jgi:hypothetical protein
MRTDMHAPTRERLTTLTAAAIAAIGLLALTPAGASAALLFESPAMVVAPTLAPAPVYVSKGTVGYETFVPTVSSPYVSTVYSPAMPYAPNPYYATPAVYPSPYYANPSDALLLPTALAVASALQGGNALNGFTTGLAAETTPVAYAPAVATYPVAYAPPAYAPAAYPVAYSPPYASYVSDVYVAPTYAYNPYATPYATAYAPYGYAPAVTYASSNVTPLAALAGLALASAFIPTAPTTYYAAPTGYYPAPYYATATAPFVSQPAIAQTNVIRTTRLFHHVIVVPRRGASAPVRIARLPLHRAAFRPAPRVAAFRSAPRVAAFRPAPRVADFRSAPRVAAFRPMPRAAFYPAPRSMAAYRTAPRMAAYRTGPLPQRFGGRVR